MQKLNTIQDQYALPMSSIVYMCISSVPAVPTHADGFLLLAFIVRPTGVRLSEHFANDCAAMWGQVVKPQSGRLAPEPPVIRFGTLPALEIVQSFHTRFPAAAALHLRDQLTALAARMR